MACGSRDASQRSAAMTIRSAWPLAVILMLGVVIDGDAASSHVAPQGSDDNPGSAKLPYATLARAVTNIRPGDTSWIHPGPYRCTSTIILTQSGDAKAPIRIRAAGSNRPVLDFSASGPAAAVHVQGAWWHLQGFDITRNRGVGLRIASGAAAHNVVENVTARGNGLSGFVLAEGAHDNLVLNCDAHDNYDSRTHGENADGFVAHMAVGTGNRFVSCRAWNNADDGYDCWEAGNSILLEHCLAWGNGVNRWNDANFQGDGNGFKLGRGEGAHVVIRCAAWDLPGRGFDLNGNASGVRIVHSIALRCRINTFAIWNNEGNIERNVLRNNIALGGPLRIDPRVDDGCNSWNIPGLEISEMDFESLDTASVTGPRARDGSCRLDRLFTLARQSRAIDAGCDVGLPFRGKAPDLGLNERNSFLGFLR